MALALLFALALSGAQPAATSPSDQPVTSTAADGASMAAPIQEKAPTREEFEDAIPEGAPEDDYGFVAWCHGALAGQIELDPIVEKDMDAIEGKEKAAKRRADDAEIAKEHRRYLALYEKALSAAEKASPTAIHQKGVDAELAGYKIWGPTRNKAPVWRMVDWGNWEVPPRCEKAAKRLYDSASLLGEALTAAPTTDAPPTTAADSAAKDTAAPAPAGAALDAAPPQTPAADALDPSKGAPPPSPGPETKPDDGLRGPQ